MKQPWANLFRRTAPLRCLDSVTWVTDIGEYVGIGALAVTWVTPPFGNPVVETKIVSGKAYAGLLGAFSFDEACF